MIQKPVALAQGAICGHWTMGLIALIHNEMAAFMGSKNSSILWLHFPTHHPAGMVWLLGNAVESC